MDDSGEVREHVPDPSLAAARRRRNLRTAGVLVLIVLASVVLLLHHVGLFDGKPHRDGSSATRSTVR